MSPHTNFHAPRTSLSGRIQIGHKSGLFIILFSVNIKPPRHRFGFSLAWGWQFIHGKGGYMHVNTTHSPLLTLNTNNIYKYG